ncbi:MAG TPA: hypothetical protein PK303_06400 [bacterium]|nr:hypothetical protein [bacterium]
MAKTKSQEQVVFFRNHHLEIGFSGKTGSIVPIKDTKNISSVY